jgi:hypothetical protein
MIKQATKNNSLKRNNDFEMIFFKFESSVSCKFRMEVTFPEQDEIQRRKNFQTAAGLGLGLRSESVIQKQISAQVHEYMIDPPSANAFLTGINEFKY